MVLPAQDDSTGLRAAVAEALGMVPEACVLGLGTGRAATAFIHGLGERVQKGLAVRAVPTSQASADLAASLGIPILSLNQVESIALTVDGADEVSPELDLIKGLGGALVREKIVAASSRKLVILAGEEKWVTRLGERGVLPVEVVPFGLSLCQKRLMALGCPTRVREKNEKVFVTDNGNYVLDCQISALADASGLERDILAIPGVVGTGLFLGMAHTALIFGEDSHRKVVRRG